eukprot:CAMPEP_0115281286 /NCGR_PEP_ID=MMETSP0270-20121206/59240_1 /TAXON_ID=71861 /ORGANISM="Scrippsiella trochoidea, Strain CCMP3099" /LENGTH=144 /DNA_ID=CAMNT_0002698079 /DNA_START=325 /DNA_END=755 /DNA_ORIENTATION=-
MQGWQQEVEALPREAQASEPMPQFLLACLVALQAMEVEAVARVTALLVASGILASSRVVEGTLRRGCHLGGPLCPATFAKEGHGLLDANPWALEAVAMLKLAVPLGRSLPAVDAEVTNAAVAVAAVVMAMVVVAAAAAAAAAAA